MALFNNRCMNFVLILLIFINNVKAPWTHDDYLSCVKSLTFFCKLNLDPGPPLRSIDCATNAVLHWTTEDVEDSKMATEDTEEYAMATEDIEKSGMDLVQKYNNSLKYGLIPATEDVKELAMETESVKVSAIDFVQKYYNSFENGLISDYLQTPYEFCLDKGLNELDLDCMYDLLEFHGLDKNDLLNYVFYEKKFADYENIEVDQNRDNLTAQRFLIDISVKVRVTDKVKDPEKFCNDEVPLLIYK